MGPPTYRPAGKVTVAAVVAVAATYVYFLLFAQFGFLQALVAAVGEDRRLVGPVLMVMGAAGMAGSFLAVRAFAGPRCRAWLAAGFAGCAVAAGGSMIARTVGFFLGVALLVGLATGVTTVTLAGLLRRALGPARLGVVIGLGTGLAYGICNLPVVFAAGPAMQAGLAAAAALAGMAAARVLTVEAPAAPPAGFDYTRPGTAAWVAVFFVLVGQDSAAFYLIQHTADLKADLWTGSGQLMANAGMHFLAAVLAGWSLDRRWLGRTVLTGAAALGAAGLLVGREVSTPAVALLYTAGVSVYSTALVFFPAFSLRPWLAALVYAVAGWGGSALGIGLAEKYRTLPGGIWLGAGGLVLAVLVGRHFQRERIPVEPAD